MGSTTRSAVVWARSSPASASEKVYRLASIDPTNPVSTTTGAATDAVRLACTRRFDLAVSAVTPPPNTLPTNAHSIGTTAGPSAAAAITNPNATSRSKPWSGARTANHAAPTPTASATNPTTSREKPSAWRETAASRNASSGLTGLADRVRTVDGTLDITSPPGGPTTVTVELPDRP